MREFKVGDAVFCPLFGNGVVVAKTTDKKFPVTVKFPHISEGKTSTPDKWFTLDGRFTLDAYPTLEHVQSRVSIAEREDAQFRVGDAVVCGIYGAGVVERLNETDTYAVSLSNGHQYTADGRITPSSFITLRHAEHEDAKQLDRESLIEEMEDTAATLARQIARLLLRGLVVALLAIPASASAQTATPPRDTLIHVLLRASAKPAQDTVTIRYEIRPGQPIRRAVRRKS